MEFNTTKFQLLRYGKNVNLKENTCYFTGKMKSVIEQVSSCKDLGVIMEDTGEFDQQIEKACSKARQKASWILRTFYSRNPNFLRHMFNTLVQPHLDYCSQLWSPVEGGKMDKLEKVLKDYTRKIPAMKHMSYWDRLNNLKMNSELRRMERYKILYTWKVLENKVPNPGIQVVNESWISGDSRRGRLCSIPKSKNKMRNSSFQNFSTLYLKD